MVPSRFKDTCIGCFMFEHAIDCKYTDKFIAELCPCQECLIKVMCETTCKEFDKVNNVVKGKR